jgi:NAD(P)-dependent dehydrogenase (short-subunit alcohol dehydrogenase family)
MGVFTGKTAVVIGASSGIGRAVARELDLESAGLTADTAAELLIASARGLQSSAASPTAYRRYLNTLARIMVAGLRRVKPS